jgi:DNA-binding CsgD family transcriptional regulator
VLESLGLDAACEALYRRMLACPQEDPAEAGKHLDFDPVQIDAAAGTLIEFGLLCASQSRPGSLRAVSAPTGMEILIARQQTELAAQQHRVEASRVAAAQLVAEYADLRPGTHAGVEQIVGLDLINERLAALVRTTSRESMTFTPRRAMSPDSMATARPMDQQVLQRGVRVRDIYLDNVRNDPASVAYIEWQTSLGAQVRSMPSLPTRMIILDRQVAFLPARSDNTAAAALILTGQGTLTVLCALFESTWSTAQPLGQAPPRDTHGLTPQESAVLHLLAEGHTDETIAKRLSVSTRTIRRITNTLMNQLQARSRFQAGMNATRQGWIQH